MRRSTRLILTAAAAAALVFTTLATAEARPRPAGRKSDFTANKTFGLGIMLGAPTGLSGKYYLGADTALDFGVGVYGYGRRRGDDDLHVHVDFLWHPVVLAKADAFWLPLYFGIGGRIWDHDYGNDDFYDHFHIGVRAPLGISLDFQNIPLDIFFEFALILDFIENDFEDEGGIEGDFTGALGVRYYFN